MFVNISYFSPESALLVQSLSMSNSLWPHGLHVACQASLSFIVSWSLLRFMSIESVMPSNHLILCHPHFPLPSIFPSIRVFFSESGLHIRWPKYRNFSVSISPSNDYSGLISFRIDLFVLLAVWTLKSLLQHHSLKACILWHSAFSVLQLSHLYMTTGKTKALTIWTYIDKVMSLMLSRFVIAFLQWGKWVTCPVCKQLTDKDNNNLVQY